MESSNVWIVDRALNISGVLSNFVIRSLNTVNRSRITVNQEAS